MFSDFLVDGAGRGLRIEVPVRPHAAALRLMASLGVEVSVTATASGIDTVFCQVGGCDWWCEGDEETRGEASEAHRLEEHPWVPAGSCFRLASAAGAALAGRSALDAMDAGEPQTSAAPASPKAASSGRRRWTRELVIAALQRFDRENGRPPTQSDWIRSGEWWPTFSTAATVCGGWSAALDAAGFSAKRKPASPQARKPTKRQVGEPKAGKAAVPSGPPSAAEQGPRPTSAAPAAVLTPSPIPAAPSAEAGSPADDDVDAWLATLTLDRDELQQQIYRLNTAAEQARARSVLLSRFVEAIDAMKAEAA